MTYSVHSARSRSGVSFASRQHLHERRLHRFAIQFAVFGPLLQ